MKRDTHKVRLKKLLNLIKNIIIKNDWKDDENIVLFQMYYDLDNENITDRWKKYLL